MRSHTRCGPKLGQSQQASPCSINCSNCLKLGHYARDCRNRTGTGYGKGEGSAGNWREQRFQSRPNSNFKHRVSTVGPAFEREVIEENDKVAEASGYTANCIILADINKPGTLSVLHIIRKLLAVFGVINGIQCPCLLVDFASPVTLILAGKAATHQTRN